jgi:hypothetical protein
MKRYPVGSFEETRQFTLRNFSRLAPEQKLRWLSEMVAFIDEANPEVRLRRLGLLPFQQQYRNRK